MQVQVNKPTALEPEYKTVQDEMNLLYINKDSLNAARTALAYGWNQNLWKDIYSGHLGLSFLASTKYIHSRNYGLMKEGRNLLSSFGTRLLSSGKLECMTSMHSNIQSNMTSTKIVDVNTISSKFLPIANLQGKELGNPSLRFNAIYKKIYDTPRLLQTEDLKVLKKITKGQNYGGTSLVSTAIAFLYTMNMRGICEHSRLRFVKGGVMLLLMAGAAFSHYNWQFAKFLDHVDHKYFYGTNLHDIEDGSIKKTNLPKHLRFEEPFGPVTSRVESLKARLGLGTDPFADKKKPSSSENNDVVK